MKRKLLAVILLALLVSLPPAISAREPIKPSSDNAQAQQHIDMAWHALDQEMGIRQVDEAIKYFEQALTLDPDNHEILIELSGEYFHRGNQMPKESDDDYEARKVYFDKGYKHAARALELKECAGSHSAVATTLAAVNENASVFTKIAMIPELKEHIDWIKDNDPGFKYGGLARFWSRINVLVPGVVIKMVGEDPEEIFEQLEAAIAIEPRYLDNYIYKADFYYHKGRKDEAFDVLDQTIKKDPEIFPEERAYNRYAQNRAKQQWKEWAGKEYPER